MIPINFRRVISILQEETETSCFPTQSSHLLLEFAELQGAYVIGLMGSSRDLSVPVIVWLLAIVPQQSSCHIFITADSSPCNGAASSMNLCLMGEHKNLHRALYSPRNLEMVGSDSLSGVVLCLYGKRLWQEGGLRVSRKISTLAKPSPWHSVSSPLFWCLPAFLTTPDWGSPYLDSRENTYFSESDA